MRTLEDVFTVMEAAELKGVTEEAVRKRLQDGRLAGTRIGGRWLIPKAALDAWTVQAHPKRKRGRDGESSG